MKNYIVVVSFVNGTIAIFNTNDPARDRWVAMKAAGDTMLGTYVYPTDSDISREVIKMTFSEKFSRFGDYMSRAINAISICNANGKSHA